MTGETVVGDVFPRLVVWTLAKQVQVAEQGQGHHTSFPVRSSHPMQAQSVLHTLCRALTSLDPSATILSINGVGAYDSISRKAMFRGLMDVVDGESCEALLQQPSNVHFGR